MSSRLLNNHASILRGMIVDMALPPLSQLMRQPGLSAVYRFIMQRHDSQMRDSVATLLLYRLDRAQIEVAYRGALAGKTLVYPIDAARCEVFGRTLRQINFDRLSDQPEIPPYGVDLWMIERAAGSFQKSVILAPSLSEGHHYTLATAVRTYLPEALREIK